MEYRIKQTDKSTFIVQGSLAVLSHVLGVEHWLTLDRQGEPFEPFRDKRFFEPDYNYWFHKFKHNQAKAIFYSIEAAQAFIKECKTDYPKYHKA